MNFTSEVGSYTRVTASGVTVALSAPCVLLGIFAGSVLTGQIVQLWDGSATGTPVIGTSTLAANTFTRLPAVLNGGLTYCVTNEDIDLTIFYVPLSRV